MVLRVGEVITPENPLFDPVRAKEEVPDVVGAVSRIAFQGTRTSETA